MITHHRHPPGITAELQPPRGTILLDLLHAVITMTTGCAGLHQLDTTRGRTIQTLTVQLLTRRAGTILSRLIVISTIAEGLPPRGTHLILPPVVAVVVLHQPVVGMTLTAHLPGKVFLPSATPSLKPSLEITLLVPCPLGLTIILLPERILLMVRPTLAIGMLILQASNP